MPNVAHSSMAGSNLHENKGAASASDDQVATVTSGATVWKKLTASNLTGTGNPFGSQLLHVRDVKTSGTASQTMTANVWQTRNLNTTLTNEISSATLSSSQITLPAGTYYIDASLPSYTCNYSIGRVYNTTTSSSILAGTVEFSVSSANVRTILKGRFTLAGTSVLEIQHYVTSGGVGTIGGTPASIASLSEVYSDVLIWKVG